MQNFRKTIFTIFTCKVLFLAALAQPKNWDKNFDGNINFYSLSDAGVFIVGTNDALYGINPVDGKEIWKLEDFKKISEEAFNPIFNSPLAAIVDRGMMVEHAIINTVTGQVVCKTKDLGMTTVNKRFSNAILGAILSPIYARRLGHQQQSKHSRLYPLRKGNLEGIPCCTGRKRGG
jgi:hypothetical protein